MSWRFRKKLVEVEAVQWDGTVEGAREIEKWSDYVVTIRVGDFANYLGFDNAHGQPRSASAWHWIVRGHEIEGEYFALSTRQFEATYEPASTPQPPALDAEDRQLLLKIATALETGALLAPIQAANVLRRLASHQPEPQQADHHV